jgi:hypothetical protein
VNGYFPFVAPAEEGAKPSDYVGREHVHGEWLWTLVVGLAAVAGIGILEGRRQKQMRQWVGICGLAALMFVVNGVVVAMTGVRSNRYMLDFHPALVLATLVVLAAGLVGRSFGKRLLGLGVAVLIPLAAIFNVLGSLQVHGFFQSTSPATYAQLAALIDGSVWPLLRSEAASVGDREAKIHWPTGNRGLRREPFFATGTRDFRDGIFIEFDGEGRGRFVFQHGEFGELMGDWFPIKAGAQATVRLAGAVLLPGLAHPWYEPRGIDERTALKRRLRVSVDGVMRFDRDVVSYDSSPNLQEWGMWRQIDGKITMFTGQIDGVKNQPLDETWLRGRKIERGAMRLNLVLPTDRYGLVEPLLAQGGEKGFDVLAIQYVRPGFVRLLHDQLGGGGRWSEEFAVDYNQPHGLEINLPGASDGVPWASASLNAIKARPDLMAVHWNGREVFRPDLAPLPASALSVALGVNWWNASGMRSFFAGHFEQLPRLRALGSVRAGLLLSRLRSDEVLKMGRGVWLRLERADGKVASLVWQKVPESGLIRLGWIEGGRLTWIAWVEPADVDVIHAHLQIASLAVGATSQTPTWLEVEVRNKGVSAQKSEFFDGQPITAWSFENNEWKGSALGLADPVESKVVLGLPGRLRLRFQLPAGGYGGSDPLLSVGRAGAADSVFLRGDGKGNYVLGLDHWGLSAVESKPITLAPDQLHTLVVELASLAKPGELPSGRARLLLDGQVVLDVAQALYPVEPKEIVFGLNPHGMSTSNPAFRGEIVSVRAQAAADDTR